LFIREAAEKGGFAGEGADAVLSEDMHPEFLDDPLGSRAAAHLPSQGGFEIPPVEFGQKAAAMAVGTVFFALALIIFQRKDIAD